MSLTRLTVKYLHKITSFAFDVDTLYTRKDCIEGIQLCKRKKNKILVITFLKSGNKVSNENKFKKIRDK